MRNLLRIRNVVLAGVLLLGAAAYVLPNTPQHSPLRAFDKLYLGAVVVTLFVLSPIALFRYFREAWGRMREVPNRSTYAVWLSFESCAALAFVTLLIYGVARTFCAHR